MYVGVFRNSLRFITVPVGLLNLGSIRALPSLYKHIHIICSALQCVAVRCSVLQCVAVCCNVLQCVAVCCSVLQCVLIGALSLGIHLCVCNVLPCVPTVAP